MAPKKKYSTAVGVAALRAAAAQERDPSVRNPDYLAIKLISPTLRALVKLRPLAWLILRQYHRIIPGGYYFHTVRTKHIDAVLKQCVGQGIEQLVILGAGLDSRAYRFHDILSEIKIFEVDHPDTQALKRKRLAKLNGNLPENVTFVPIDFDEQFINVLLDFRYSAKLKTLFIWEGVCMYISPEAVDNILQFVSHLAGPGSSVVFDYIFQSMVDGKCDYYGARESSRQAAKLGAPYIFGIEEGTIAEFLATRGLALVSEFTSEMLEQTYLRRSNGKIHGKVYGYTNIVHASLQI